MRHHHGFRQEHAVIKGIGLKVIKSRGKSGNRDTALNRTACQTLFASRAGPSGKSFGKRTCFGAVPPSNSRCNACRILLDQLLGNAAPSHANSSRKRLRPLYAPDYGRGYSLTEALIITEAADHLLQADPVVASQHRWRSAPRCCNLRSIFPRRLLLHCPRPANPARLGGPFRAAFSSCVAGRTCLNNLLGSSVQHWLSAAALALGLAKALGQQFIANWPFISSEFAWFSSMVFSAFSPCPARSCLPL